MNTKDAYIQKFKAKLDEWNAEIAQLKAKADESSAEMKFQYQDQINFLQAKTNEMSNKLDEFIKHSGDAWHEMAKGMEQAFEDLSAACKSATSKFHS